jgi:Fur family zinc uptake transcriptional regulator
MNHAAAVLKDRPVSVRPRMTRNDRTVFTCLENHGQPMKAYELLECLRQEGINAPMTVYRALSRLTDRGLVRKIESLNAYYALPPGEKASCAAFLICRRCKALSFRHLDGEVVSSLTKGIEVADAYIELKTDCLARHGETLMSGACQEAG